MLGLRRYSLKITHQASVSTLRVIWPLRRSGGIRLVQAGLRSDSPRSQPVVIPHGLTLRGSCNASVTRPSNEVIVKGLERKGTVAMGGWL